MMIEHQAIKKMQESKDSRKYKTSYIREKLKRKK